MPCASQRRAFSHWRLPETKGSIGALPLRTQEKRGSPDATRHAQTARAVRLEGRKASCLADDAANPVQHGSLTRHRAPAPGADLPRVLASGTRKMRGHTSARLGKGQKSWAELFPTWTQPKS